MRYFKVKYLFIIMAAVLLTSCVRSMGVTPVQKDVIQIDLTGVSSYDRTGMQDELTVQAAKTTLICGYNSFIVVSSHVLNDSNGKIVVHMFHKGDPGAEKAVDAIEYLKWRGIKDIPLPHSQK